MKTLFTSNVLILFFTFSIALGSTTAFAQPANDLIVHAIDLNYGPLPYSEANVNFPDATITGDISSAGCSQSEPGIWYKFYATKAGSVSAFIQTNDSAIVTFYSSDVGDATHAVQLTYVDQASNICGFGNFSQIDTEADTYYYIYMRNLDVSTVAINVSNAFASPENDWIIMATEVDVNNPTQIYENIHFLTALNSVDGGQAGCDTEGIPGIWYKFFTQETMEITATLSSADNISTIIFYKSLYGDAANSTDLEHVSQPQNQCGLHNTASITTEAGNWYYIFASTLEAYADVTVEAMTLGVSDNELVDFKFYPNPVANEMNLSAKSTIDEIGIFNLMGQKVFSEKIGMASSSINLGHLSPGLYVMNVSSEGKSASYKIVKK